MRAPSCLLAALSLVACVPAKPVARKPENIQQPLPPAAIPLPEAAPVAKPPPQAPVSEARVTSTSVAGITFEGVTFDSRSHRLVVVDQPGGPGSRFADAASAARSRNGLAAINASFFTPEGNVVGLAVSAGKSDGSWNGGSSIGNSVWYDSGNSSGIARREKIGRAGATSMRELIQSGPLLVENGKAIGGLETEKNSARSVVLWDGGTRWWIGRSSPCTLTALAQALANTAPAGWPVRQALNLDGGRSSDLWVSGSISGGPLERRPVWNRPVRNFLVLVRK